MPKKIKPYLGLEDLERNCEDHRELIFFMRGWFGYFVNNYNKMKMSEIKRYIEDLKISFEFLDRGFKK